MTPLGCDPSKEAPTERAIDYRGYRIVAAPLELADPPGWSTDLWIECIKPGEVVPKPFDTADIFQTEQEAIHHCLEFGRQIVDGKFPNLSPP